jgi:hypothetical protein
MSSDDGYDRLGAIVAERDITLGYLEQVSDGLAQLSGLGVGAYPDGVAGRAGMLAQLDQATRRLGATIRTLAEAKPEEARDLSVSAMAQLQALESDIDEAEDQTTSASVVAVQIGKVGTVFSSIKKALTKAWKRLWSLISHLTTVKEWSVSGQAGTGILGFAQATITVTFG